MNKFLHDVEVTGMKFLVALGALFLAGSMVYAAPNKTVLQKTSERTKSEFVCESGKGVLNSSGVRERCGRNMFRGYEGECRDGHQVAFLDEDGCYTTRELHRMAMEACVGHCPEDIPPQPNCVDSDGGNEPFEPGTVQYNLRFPERFHQEAADNCSGNRLQEYFCTEDDLVDSTLTSCADGCQDGACLSAPPAIVLDGCGEPEGGWVDGTTYQVARSFTVPEAFLDEWSCFRLTETRDITIDCMDNKITNPDIDSFLRGIYVTNSSGVTIQNCRLEGFLDGIDIFQSQQVELTNNHLIENFRLGISLGRSAHIDLLANHVSGTLDVVAPGMTFSQNEHVTIKESSSIGNGTFGLVLSENHHVLVEDSNFSGNDIGIKILDNNMPQEDTHGSTTLRHNIIRNNVDFHDWGRGLFIVESSHPLDIQDNTICGNSVDVEVRDPLSSSLTAAQNTFSTKLDPHNAWEEDQTRCR